jgi:hypothetical protein
MRDTVPVQDHGRQAGTADVSPDTESTVQAHTPGPWAWQQMGDMKLVGQHGRRPIVLDCVGRRKTLGPPALADFRVRNAERDLMVPFDKDHPDARLIAAAPVMLKALKHADEWLDELGCDCGTDEPGTCAFCEVRAAIAKAEGR